jgi:hypothetical protein
VTMLRARTEVASAAWPVQETVYPLDVLEGRGDPSPPGSEVKKRLLGGRIANALCM